MSVGRRRVLARAEIWGRDASAHRRVGIITAHGVVHAAARRPSTTADARREPPRTSRGPLTSARRSTRRLANKTTERSSKIWALESHERYTNAASLRPRSNAPSLSSLSQPHTSLRVIFHASGSTGNLATYRFASLGAAIISSTSFRHCA